MRLQFFTAPWCAACRQVKPFVEREAAAAGVPVEYVDVSVEPERANSFGVRNLPTILIIDSAGTVRDLITSSQIAGRLPAALREAAND